MILVRKTVQEPCGSVAAWKSSAWTVLRVIWAEPLAARPAGYGLKAVRPVSDDEVMPVLDSSRLRLLAQEVGNKAAYDFLATYLRLLPTRMARIVDQIASGDIEASMDAVLSLKVTSSMIGAIRLEHYCQALQHQLSLGRLADAETAKSELSEHLSLLLRETGRN